MSIAGTSEAEGSVGVLTITGETSETTGTPEADTSEGNATVATIEEGLDSEDTIGIEALTLGISVGTLVTKGLTTGVETTDDVSEGMLETAVVDGVVRIDVAPELTGTDMIPLAAGTFVIADVEGFAVIGELEA